MNAPASEKKHSFFEPFAFTQHLSIRSTVVDCQDKIYSEEYEDYIVEYGSWSELVSEQYQTDCYQLADFRFAVVYLEGSAVDESRRNAELGDTTMLWSSEFNTDVRGDRGGESQETVAVRAFRTGCNVRDC